MEEKTSIQQGLASLKAFLLGSREVVQTPEQVEAEEYRQEMRQQFMKLKNRGLSIRVMTA